MQEFLGHSRDISSSQTFGNIFFTIPQNSKLELMFRTRFGDTDGFLNAICEMAGAARQQGLDRPVQCIKLRFSTVGRLSSGLMTVSSDDAHIGQQLILRTRNNITVGVCKSSAVISLRLLSAIVHELGKTVQIQAFTDC
jgi:hypothetical protein